METRKRLWRRFRCRWPCCWMAPKVSRVPSRSSVRSLIVCGPTVLPSPSPMENAVRRGVDALPSREDCQRAQTRPVSHRGRRATAVLAGTLLSAAALCGGFAGRQHGPGPATSMPMTLLVEGRVGVMVPAQWVVQRVTAGPGSARVQVDFADPRRHRCARHAVFAAAAPVARAGGGVTTEHAGPATRRRVRRLQSIRPSRRPDRSDVSRATRATVTSCGWCSSTSHCGSPSGVRAPPGMKMPCARCATKRFAPRMRCSEQLRRQWNRTRGDRVLSTYRAWTTRKDPDDGTWGRTAHY